VTASRTNGRHHVGVSFDRRSNRSDSTMSLRRDERGLSTVEYIIILVLIAVIAIVAWKQFGESVEYHVRDSTTQINHLGD
jgi:Flp pilus assembly pilin Flp